MKENHLITEYTAVLSQIDNATFLDLSQNPNVQWWFGLTEVERLILFEHHCYELSDVRYYTIEYSDKKPPVLVIGYYDREHYKVRVPLDLLDVSIGNFKLLHLISKLNSKYNTDLNEDRKETFYIKGEFFDYLNAIVDKFSDDAFVRISKYVNINLSELSFFPINWGRFKGINELSFKNLQTEIPTELSGFNDVSSIYFEESSIEKFPFAFPKFKSLEWLGLYGTNINVIQGDAVCGFEHLVELSLSGNKLTVEDVLKFKSLPNLKLLWLPESLKDYQNKLVSEFGCRVLLSFCD